LLVDDDEVFLRVAARAPTPHGFNVCIAHDIETALHSLSTETNFAIVDLQLGNASGLSLVPKLKEVNPSMGILIRHRRLFHQVLRSRLLIFIGTWFAQNAPCRPISAQRMTNARLIAKSHFT
jgi:CheY-like chemotaxis protein